ncbi:DUF308 domain-containing protein [Acidisoma cellulosilytica]|uniref:DUF308 domain-containing protein n=1 Tax=Acidisoma cellulosilyticum TaxID=2802395 RepID=A0A963Z5X8_9PROT|nr:DUF308 domain-containing protein [Acidisoma cellulosilyticum]
MSPQNKQAPDIGTETRWLKSYYLSRAGFSIIWVACAFTIGQTIPIATALLLVYPAWDAAANFVDAKRSGGLASNKSQMLNFVISVATTLAVAIALTKSMNAVLAVFGVWAALSGLFQLVTGLRRWKSYGAQWAMILSGGQSVLVAAHFVAKARGHAPVDVTTVAPYAAFGAFYFLVSGVWLLVSDARRRSNRMAA